MRPAAEPSDAAGGLPRLEADGLLRLEEGRYRTTRRFQAAMARAALCLYHAGEGSADLRLPIAHALVELYGDALGDADVAELVEAMLPIERAELAPIPALSG